MEWFVLLGIILIIFPELPAIAFAFVLVCSIELAGFLWKRKLHVLGVAVLLTVVYYWSWL